MEDVLGRKRTIKLKSGEEMLAGVVEHQMPQELMRRLQYLLVAKAPQYYTHFDEYMAHGLDGVEEGLEWRFYLGFLKNQLVGSICTWEHRGIGILGHVYTSDSVRGKGVATALMNLVQEDFSGRGGRVMELNTGPGSNAQRIYARFGYRDLPGVPGSMVHEAVPGTLEALFEGERTTIAPLEWRHWPTLNLLTLQEEGEYIRSVAMNIYGPGEMEAALIKVRAAEAKGRLPGAVLKVLENEVGTAFGLGTVLPDPHFGGHGTHHVLDLFIHPKWRHLEAQLAESCAEAWPQALVCYRSEPAEWFQSLGFTRTGTIPGAANSQDVMVWVRPPAGTKGNAR